MESFSSVLQQAIADLTEHGFDSVERVDRWVAALRAAARGAVGSTIAAEKLVTDGLAAIYQKLVERGGLSRYNPGVARFTLERVRPQLRAELDRRIVASAQLIKRNREEAVEKTLQRFQGWATSVPPGGAAEVDKRELRSEFSKPIRQQDFATRRVVIDQSAKLTANISRTVAEGSNAIAGVWHSQWRRAGYQFRKDHKERDQKVYLIRDSWAHKRGLVKPGPAGYTDQITQPAEEVFCLPGTSKVPFADSVEKAYRRFYSGPVATVRLSSGSVLTATPNHPILTDKGWVALGALYEGCHVVEVADKIVETFEEDEHDTRVPVIAEVFSALAENGVSQTLQQRPADFHGDGAEGQINVVLAARPLTFSFSTTHGEHVNDFALAKTADARSTRSALNQSVLGLFRTAQSIVRSGCDALTVFGRRVRHAQQHRFARVARVSSDFVDTLPHNTARNAKVGRDLQDSFAGSVTCEKGLAVEHNAAALCGAAAPIKAFLSGATVERTHLDAEDGRDLLDRFPFRTKTSCVTEVHRGAFTGHVYNLQTASGWYVAENIVTHNCSCTYKYIYNLRQLPDDMLTNLGREELQAARGKVQKALAASGVVV